LFFVLLNTKSVFLLCSTAATLSALLLTENGVDDEIVEEYPKNVPLYHLNLDQGEQNISSFFAHRNRQFEFVKGAIQESIDSIVVHKQVCDITDFTGSKHSKIIRAFLLDNKRGIKWQEPSLSDFMITQVDQIFKRGDAFKDEEMSKSLKASHLYNVVSICDDPKRQLRTFVLLFPDDIVGRMGYMNPSEGLELTPHYTVVRQCVKKEVCNGPKDLDFTQVLVSFVIAVESEENRLLKLIEKKEEVNHSLADLYKRMSNCSMTSP
jgi:hypothetical protein